LRVTDHYSKSDSRKIEALAKAKADVVWFVHNFCWTNDPRLLRHGVDPVVPFDPWEKQVEFLRWLEGCWERGESCLAEKSRDAGLTYLCCFFALQKWLFFDGFNATFGSRKLDLVDRQGDPDSIFEKIRIARRELPDFFIPVGFSEKRHDTTCRMINPQRGSVITGEGGDEIGRGGRSSILIIDEHSSLPQAEQVDAAASMNADTILYLGTPRGMGNLFARKRFSGSLPVFTIRWQEDPRKDEAWYQQQLRELDATTVAQEIDLDYGASGEPVVIPSEWVQAACDIELEQRGPIIAGLDVAESGTNLSVFLCRQGPVVPQEWIESWSGHNTTQTARRADELAKRIGAEQLRYDRVGVGAGVHGTLESGDGLFKEEQERSKSDAKSMKLTQNLRLSAQVASLGEMKGQNDSKRFKLNYIGVNVGEAASFDYFDDDDEHPNYDRFLNLRAELWWNLRLRFENTWEHLNGVNEHIPQDMISIPRSASQLVAELSLPRLERANDRRVQIESKKKMRGRGISSPDFADALVLAFANVEPFEVLLARV